MLPRSALAVTLCLGVVGAAPALAQGMAETGAGTGPTSTITAPNTSAVGRTKPPGAAGAPATPETRDARTERMKQDDKIMKGICIGCGAK